jgi:hypothetical protein
MRAITRKQAIALGLAFLLGAFGVVAIRFATVKKVEVHHHANFAVFVNGDRLPFDSFLFYEEVQSCGGDEVSNPKIRVHMHDQKNDTLHVHDNGATWGQFFANLGMTAGDTLFKTDKATFVEGLDDVIIRYKLNGEEVQTIANRAINSEDTLVVSIGNPSDEDLQNQYDQITHDADEYNKKNDPSSCSGGKPFTTTERLKEALGIN